MISVSAHTRNVHEVVPLSYVLYALNYLVCSLSLSDLSQNVRRDRFILVDPLLQALLNHNEGSDGGIRNQLGGATRDGLGKWHLLGAFLPNSYGLKMVRLQELEDLLTSTDVT